MNAQIKLTKNRIVLLLEGLGRIEYCLEAKTRSTATDSAAHALLLSATEMRQS